MTVGLDGRCGTCARFVRIHETVDDNGEVKRAGECLLEVWSPPLYETNTCSQYVKRGTFSATAKSKTPTATRASRRRSNSSTEGVAFERPALEITLPEDLLAMDADEFRSVLRSVLRDELGLSDVELGGR
jgi:hypothetical protein